MTYSDAFWSVPSSTWHVCAVHSYSRPPSAEPSTFHQGNTPALYYSYLSCIEPTFSQWGDQIVFFKRIEGGYKKKIQAVWYMQGSMSHQVASVSSTCSILCGMFLVRVLTKAHLCDSLPLVLVLSSTTSAEFKHYGIPGKSSTLISSSIVQYRQILIQYFRLLKCL